MLPQVLCNSLKSQEPTQQSLDASWVRGTYLWSLTLPAQPHSRYQSIATCAQGLNRAGQTLPLLHRTIIQQAMQLSGESTNAIGQGDTHRLQKKYGNHCSINTQFTKCFKMAAAWFLFRLHLQPLSRRRLIIYPSSIKVEGRGQRSRCKVTHLGARYFVAGDQLLLQIKFVPGPFTVRLILLS